MTKTKRPKNKFSRREFDDYVPSGTFYNVISAAKDNDVCTEHEEAWGKREEGRPLKYYDIDEMLEWFKATDKFTQSVRKIFLTRLKELKE